jgi:nucleoside-diphosphate-sugar epimerase
MLGFGLTAYSFGYYAKQVGWFLPVFVGKTAMTATLLAMVPPAGHDVIGMTRSSAKADMLRAIGARPVVADALDPDAVARAVAETEPEVIVHQLTALKGEPGLRDMRNPDRFGAMTNRLRTEGTDHLLAAGRAVGIRRFIAQSIVAIGTYARTGGPVKRSVRPGSDIDLGRLYPQWTRVILHPRSSQSPGPDRCLARRHETTRLRPRRVGV